MAEITHSTIVLECSDPRPSDGTSHCPEPEWLRGTICDDHSDILISSDCPDRASPSLSRSYRIEEWEDEVSGREIALIDPCIGKYPWWCGTHKWMCLLMSPADRWKLSWESLFDPWVITLDISRFDEWEDLGRDTHDAPAGYVRSDVASDECTHLIITPDVCWRDIWDRDGKRSDHSGSKTN